MIHSESGKHPDSITGRKPLLRIGSVGTSSIMNVIQEAIRQTEGITCHAVYSRNEARGNSYAQKEGVSLVFTDYEDFVNCPELDVIYIASPNTCHVEQALTALQAGKHVIVEKPASLTTEGIDLMTQTALKNGVYWFEAITTLFMPNYIACKDLLPSLGAVQSAVIRYGQYSSRLDEYNRGIISSSLNPSLGGGALNDMGIYCIHAAIDLFGQPLSIISRESVKGPNGVDLETILNLDYGTFCCRIEAAKNRDIGSGCLVKGEHGYFAENGPMNNFGTCESELNGRPLRISLQANENRMLYELSRFRDAILFNNDAFFWRMVHQSRCASACLEKANRL